MFYPPNDAPVTNPPRKVAPPPRRTRDLASEDILTSVPAEEHEEEERRHAERMSAALFAGLKDSSDVEVTLDADDFDTGPPEDRPLAKPRHWAIRRRD